MCCRLVFFLFFILLQRQHSFILNIARFCQSTERQIISLLIGLDRQTFCILNRRINRRVTLSFRKRNNNEQNLWCNQSEKKGKKRAFFLETKWMEVSSRVQSNRVKLVYRLKNSFFYSKSYEYRIVSLHSEKGLRHVCLEQAADNFDILFAKRASKNMVVSSSSLKKIFPTLSSLCLTSHM